MLGLALVRLGTAKLTFGILQLDGTAEQLLAFIALVTLGLIVLAGGVGTGTCYIPIGQEPIALLTIALLHGVLKYASVLARFVEYLLDDGGVPWCARPTKVIKFDVEPFVDVVMDLKIVVADFLGRLPLLEGLDFRGRPVFVRAADVQHIVAVEPLVPCKHIGRKHTPDKIAEVWYVVDIGQCTRNQDVLALARDSLLLVYSQLLRVELGEVFWCQLDFLLPLLLGLLVLLNLLRFVGFLQQLRFLCGLLLFVLFGLLEFLELVLGQFFVAVLVDAEVLLVFLWL